MKKDTESKILKDLALIEYFINYQSSLDCKFNNCPNISRFAVSRHTQWIGWLIDPHADDLNY
ncbi:MAG: hypothetical protein LWX55_14065 [Deltaproteobacteria bacterium]|jgi:hypothetical protein|nr:hypothetical protein [Deltaproteobacteria bacterium]